LPPVALKSYICEQPSSQILDLTKTDRQNTNTLAFYSKLRMTKKKNTCNIGLHGFENSEYKQKYVCKWTSISAFRWSSV